MVLFTKKNKVEREMDNAYYEVSPEIIEDFVNKTNEISLTLTERAIVKQIFKAIKGKLLLPNDFLRKVLNLTIYNFSLEIQTPLQKIAALNLEARSELILKLRLMLNEAFLEIIPDKQREIIDALNSYFSKYIIF